MTKKRIIISVASCAAAIVLVFGGLSAVRRSRVHSLESDSSEITESIVVTEDDSSEEEITSVITSAPETVISSKTETTALTSTTTARASTTTAATTTKKATTTTKKGNTTGTTTRTVGGQTTVVVNNGGGSTGGGNTTQATNTTAAKTTTTTSKPNTTTTTTAAANEQPEIREITPPDVCYITSTSVSGTSCTLTWENIDCDGYEIWYAAASTIDAEWIPNTVYRFGTDIPNGNVTTATVSNLVGESSYCFQIQPYKYNYDGSKIYGFYSVAKNPTFEEITTDYNFDEFNAREVTWETYYSDVTIRIDYEKTYEMIDKANAERASLGVAPYEVDRNLMDIAALRAAEYITVASKSHSRPNGMRCFTTGEGSEGIKTGYEPFGSGDPLHYGNMTDPRWKSTGACVIEINDEYGVFYILVQTYGENQAETEARRSTGDYTFSVEQKPYHWSY